MLSIFEILQKNYSKESVFQYAKMGFLEIEQSDILNWKIIVRNGELNKINLKKILFMNLKNKQEIEYYNELRKKIIEPIENLKQKIRKGKNSKRNNISNI